MSERIYQNSFAGGMNLLSPDITLAENEYVRGENFRIRTGAPVCIKEPEIENGPSGLKQGIFAYEDFILVFCAGRAYYKNIVTNGVWTQIVDFAMRPDVNYIYGCAVPVSKNNFERRLQETKRIDGSSTETNVTILNSPVNTTPAGLVCQDGYSQPYLIEADASASQLQTYAEWTKETREYVPIGTRMVFLQGILFVLGQDGVTLFRSVSGRPLDFVVNVKADGNKGGEAETVAYAPSSNLVTCLSALKTGELFVGTRIGCYPLELNYEKTIFAEPTFLNRKSFSAGIVNQYGFLDILTDYTMIDFDGIRSWNAIFQQENEGRNSLFSSRISKALINIEQSTTVTASILFDNYAIYSINTIWGNRLAVFDTIMQVWVSFDNLGIGAIKQFAIARQSNRPTLYAITATDIYKLYQGENTLAAQLYPRAIDSGSASVCLQLEKTYLMFDEPNIDDTPTVTEIADNKVATTIAGDVVGDGAVEPVLFNFEGQSRLAKKVQTKISWDNDAALTQVEVSVKTDTSATPFKQTAKSF